MRVVVLVVPRREGMPERHRLAHEHLVAALPAPDGEVRRVDLLLRAPQLLRRELRVLVLAALLVAPAAHPAAPERRTVAPAPADRHPHAVCRRGDDVVVPRHGPHDAEVLLQKPVDGEGRRRAPPVVAPEVEPVADQLRIRRECDRLARFRRRLAEDDRQIRLLCLRHRAKSPARDQREMPLELGARIRRRALLVHAPLDRHGRQARLEPGLDGRLRPLRIRAASRKPRQSDNNCKHHVVHSLVILAFRCSWPLCSCGTSPGRGR